MLLFGSCVWVRPVCRRNTACFGCSAELAEPAGRLRSGSPSPEMPVAVRRFCAVPGLNPLSGSAFRVRFPGPLSGSTFRTRLSDPLSGSASGLFRACSGSVSGSASGPAFGSAQDLFPGLLSGLASGAVSRMLVLFCLIAECGVWFRSGRRIRLCDFCRSRFRRRACNSLLPVFLGLRREPVI